jgi:Ca2+-binding RTX toxin-like protein
MLMFVLGAVPGVAAASTVKLDPTTNRAVFAGGTGPNDVTMHIFGGPEPSPFASGPRVWFLDAAQDLTAGSGCVASVAVWCPTLGADVSLGGGHDRYRGFSSGPIAVTGGSGADHIHANGDTTSVTGGAGADWIEVGSNGNEAAHGENGDDNIRDLDAIVPYTTILSGGSGDDLLYGEARGRGGELSGDAGNDALIVRGGNTVTGGAGEDVLMVVPSPSSFLPASTMSGGDDADTIVGGWDADTVSGGAGNDVIDVSGDAGRDDLLGPDTVDCGAGDDTVYADADDVIANDCEHRPGGGMPTNQGVNAALARLADAFGVTAAG